MIFDDSPSTLSSYADLLAWYDSPDVNDITEVSSRISAHTDSSNTLGSLSQGTAAKQPKYQTSSINGKNTILFADGSGTYGLLGATSINGGAGLTEFCIIQLVMPTAGVTTSGYLLSKDGNGANVGDASLLYSSNRVRYSDTNGISLAALSKIDDKNADGTQRPHIIMATMNQTDGYKLYIDGELEDENTTTGNTIWNNAFALELGSVLNAGVSFYGEIGETLIYNKIPPANEITSLHRYLANRFKANVDTGIVKLGLKAWLLGGDVDGDGDTTDNPANGASIPTWSDRTANAINGTQGTGTRQPTYDTTGINGENALSFNRANGQYLSINGLATYSNGEHSFFIVMDVDSSAGASAPFSFNSSTGGNTEVYIHNGDGTIDLYAAITTNRVCNVGTNNEKIILYFSHTDTTIETFLNGIKQSVYMRSLPSASAQGSIGQEFDGATPSNFLHGLFAELIFYDRVLTDEERGRNLSFLSDKYTISTDEDIPPQDLAIWVDAYDLTDGAVSTWTNKGDSAYTITQGTGTKQPIRNSTGLNGLPTVAFDGDDDELVTNLSLDPTTTPNATIFVVFQFNSGDSGLFGGDNGTWNRLMLLNFSSLSNDTVVGFSDTSAPIRISQLSTGVYLATIKYTTGFGELGINGAVKQRKTIASLGSTTLDMVLGNIAEGSVYPLDGSISEFICYTRALQTQEILKVDEYLRAKWNTTNALPIPKDYLEICLETDDTDTVVQSTGSVSIVHDRTYNGRKAEQGTSTSQPTYSLTGFGGTPGLSFNGTSDFMTIANTLASNMAYADYEIFCTFKSSSTSIQFLFASATSEMFECHLNGAAGLRFIPTTLKYSDLGTNGQYVDGNIHIANPRLVNNVAIASVDEVDTTDTETPARSGTNALFMIGKRGNDSYPLNGYMGDLFVFSKTLTTAERTTVINYIKDKRGL